MKKLTTSVFMLLFACISYAQSNFFTPTVYRGAIDPDSTKDWTKGWSNWDPTMTVYSSPTVTINGGDITSNTTWTKNNIYLLNDGYIYVTGGATLTIEAGTIIRGVGKGTIIICRGSKINAKGTLAEPIVFTSSKGAGLRAPGDWGGVVLTGRGLHNLPQGDTAAAEGGIAKPVTGSGEIDGRHGGTNDDDSSGVMSFCRIEFAGIPLTTAANSEINGLTLYSVGRKTQIDHIQVSYSGDDSYEWFGGAVNCKYLIAYAGIDDDFDTDNGYKGLVQFGVGIRIPSNADQSGSNGFESDNDANGSQNSPRTSAVFSNITIVGPLFSGQTATINSNFQRAAHIRRNSALTVVNSILSGYPSAGLLIDSRLTNSHFQNGTAVFKSNIIGGIPSGNAGRLASNSDTLSVITSAGVSAWLVSSGQTDTFNLSNDIGLTRPYFYTNPNFAPSSTSVAKINANFNTGKTPYDAKPIVDFTVLNSGLTYTFTNLTLTKGFVTRYSWDFGVASTTTDTSTLMNPVFTFPSNGNFSVTLKATNSFDSTTLIKVVVVNVNLKPGVDFTFAQVSSANRNFIFNNLTNTRGYATTYLWDFGVAGNSDSSTLMNPIFTFPSNGFYTVTLKARNQYDSLSVSKIIGVTITVPQNNFFEYTSYRGALSSDTTKDWTKGWSNFEPVTTVYPTHNISVNGGDITTNTTWTKNNVYLLNDGYVYVTGGATLTIEAGTIIRGTGKGTVIICRGSKIIAKGTLAEPIIFTSSKGAGLRAPGDWGGVVLTGRAIHNLPQGDTAAAEGGIAKPVTGAGEIDGRHGGTNDDDSSGVMSYCRIEFAGIPLTTAANSEINGLTLYSVGRKTQIDHIQVSYSGDDSYEWFGGTVNGKYLIAFAGIDDDFDTDNGYRGNVQFGIGARIPSNADQSGSNGFESDNDANGTNNAPRTSAVFSNITIVGPLYSGQTATVNNNFQRAAHIRRNSALSVINSILSGYPSAGLFIDSRLTNSHFQNGTAIFKSNIIGGIPSGNAGRLASNSDTLSLTSSLAVSAWLITGQTDTFNQSNEIKLTRPFFYANPNYAPTSVSVAKTGTNFTTGKTPFNSRANVGFSFNQSVPNSKVFSFINTTDTKGIETRYLWDFGVSSSIIDTSSMMNPSYSYPANGTYIVTLYAINIFDTAFISKTVTVFVTDKPAANFNFVQTSTSGSREFTFTNTTDSKGFVTTYAWDFGVTASSQDTSSAVNPVFIYPANGSYLVKLIATNAFLADTFTKAVTVVSTFIDEPTQSFKQVQLYPNPTYNKLSITFDLIHENNVTIEILDVTGKMITGTTAAHFDTGGNTIDLNTSEISQGIYFVRLVTPEAALTNRIVILK
ncbi:MAG: PKD domain-containing protein [Bacteroidia bacterium]|nr:PKD domain-containing protein [Bacteroidia bacterium]